MSHRTLSFVKKSIACAIIAGLIITAPGINCYQALAQSVASPVKAVNPAVGGQGVAGAAGQSFSGVGTVGSIDATFGGANIMQGTLPGIHNPEVEAFNAAVMMTPGGSFVPTPEPAQPLQAAAPSSSLSVPAAVIGKTPAAPAAKAAVPVEFSGSQKAAAAVEEGSALSRTRDGMDEVLTGKVSAPSFLGRLFHGQKTSGLPAPVKTGAWSFGRSVKLDGTLGVRHAAPESREDAAPQAVENLETAPAAAAEPVAKKPSMWLVMGLGIAGGVGAFFAAPYAAVAAAVVFPAWIAAHSLLFTGLVTGAGLLTGLGLSQVQVWKGYPKAVWQTARAAGSSTFNFWARFGKIFDAVITSRDMDEARKGDLPLNIFKYPVLAWPFVLIGYGAGPLTVVGLATALSLPISWPVITAAVLFGGAPVAFAAGFVYKALGTPLQAAYQGLKQLVLEFFPWLRDFFRWVHRVLGKVFPFVGGFFLGGVRAAGISIAVGAMTLARPIWRNVVDAGYAAVDRHDESPLVMRFAELAGVRLLQLGGLIGIVVAGAVGGAMGLLLSVPFAAAEAFHTAFKKAGIEGRLPRFFKAWHRYLEAEEGFGGLTEGGYHQDRFDELSLGSGIVRFANSLGHSLYGIPALLAMAVTGFIRTTSRAIRFVRTGQEPVKVDTPVLIEKPEADKTGKAEEAKPVEKKKPNVWPPLLLGTLGSALAGFGAYKLFLAGASLLSWPALVILGGAAVIGGGIGLALSQPSAFKGYFSSIFKKAGLDSGAAFRSWARLGLSSEAALRNREVDPNLEAAPPKGIGSYHALAKPAVLAGYVSSGLSYAGGGLLQAVGRPMQAAWQGMVVILTAGLIRRIIRAVRKVITKAVPFAFGFVWGAIRGVAYSAWGGAALLAAPMFLNAVAPERGEYKMRTISETIAVRLTQAVAIVLGLASGLAGLVVGAVVGLPIALTTALSYAIRWADVGGKLENSVRIWEKETFRSETKRLEDFLELKLGTEDVDITYWQGLVRAGNIVGHAALSVFWAPALSVTAWARSVSRASRYAKLRDPDKSAYSVAEEILKRGIPGLTNADSDRGSITLVFESLAALENALSKGVVSHEMEGYPIEFQVRSGKPDEEIRATDGAVAAERAAPTGRPASSRKSAGASLVLGLAAAAGAVAGAHLFLLPMLGLAGYWALGGYAASAIMGMGAGLALPQIGVWKTYPKVMTDSVGQGASESTQYWGRTGEAYARVLKGDMKAEAGLLALPHKVVGYFGAFVGVLAGVAHGLVAVPLRAGLTGARKVLESILPWIKDFFHMLWRVAKRFFPFVGGAIGGIITGVVGTAFFGALLMGRPYFKYVLAEDMDTGSVGKWIGTALTKVVAFVAGVVSGIVGLGLLFGLPAGIGLYFFGVPGLALGLLTALPFSLTLSVSMAFQLADIGGKSQKFFDLWVTRSLRTEMHLVNKLTDTFDFNEERTSEGELRIGDAWIRMANIAAGTMAASVAAVVASLVAYPRSIYRAFKDLRAGKDIPADDGYDDLGKVWDTAEDFSKGGRKILSRVVGAGGVIGGLYLLISSFWKGGFLAALWKAPLLALLGWPAGWIGGLILGGVIGVLAGFIVWLGMALSKEPPRDVKEAGEDTSSL